MWQFVFIFIYFFFGWVFFSRKYLIFYSAEVRTFYRFSDGNCVLLLRLMHSALQIKWVAHNLNKDVRAGLQHNLTCTFMLALLEVKYF